LLQGKKTIDLASLKDGIYYLYLKDGNRITEKNKIEKAN